LTISTISLIVGGYLALSYAPPILVPLIMGSMPSDVETLSIYEPPDDFSREVDEHIKNCALAVELRAHPGFRESRPHLKIPPEVRQHNLTAGTLAGQGMIVVPPYYFNEKDGKSMVQIFYVGPDCSGHPGIVHGGFLATMLDEGLARCAFPAMPNKVGVTANLQISYLKPTMAGQFLVLRAKTTKVEGRKAWAEGWIESLEVPEGEEPAKLVEASALFVEPKHANVSHPIGRAACGRERC
jgi:acyl-coenzyme A thioesterase PaaI-like protein